MANHEHCCDRFVVTGRVQGVGFRAATYEQARQLDVAGWVRNCPDGSVEVVAAHADGQVLEALADWLQTGPSHASVAELRRASHNSNSSNEILTQWPGNLPWPFEIRR